MNWKRTKQALAIIFMAALTTTAEAKTQVTKQPFGKMPDGNQVDIYTLTNGPIEARIMTYGGIVVSLKTPDSKGNSADVVLGFDTFEPYLKNKAFFGAIIGRYANRIAHATFTLDGKKYSLEKNDGDNSLHGGNHGLDKVLWKAKPINNGIELSYVSKDGEGGYPGTLSVTVRYTLSADALRIEYSATTDKDTVLNLTNHSYFNLAGKGDILQNQLRINASRFTPVDANLIPTGELKPVASTPFDFRKATPVGQRINDDDEQLRRAGGYDHNWVLDAKGGNLAEAAEVYEPTTGRVLQVLTTQPGVQFYTGNFLDGSITGKNGQVYEKRSALCLETQHFPDSPNHPKFPTTELKPGERFHSITVYKFSAR